MAKTLYFNGETELKANSIHSPTNRRADMVGEPVGFVPTFDRTTQRWVHNFIPVERVINFKSSPSSHECDARCMNASGRTMNCECSCGGKNHGRGAFACAEVA